MNLSSIRQSIESINYSWTNPLTSLVLIPGVSLLINRVQLAKVVPMLMTAKHSIQEEAAASNKFLNICKWHFRGSAIQTVVCFVAFKIFANQLLLLLSVFALMEFAGTAATALKHRITLVELDAQGNVKKLTNVSALRFF